jgi:hypothetical protein
MNSSIESLSNMLQYKYNTYTTSNRRSCSTTMRKYKNNSTLSSQWHPSLHTSSFKNNIYQALWSSGQSSWLQILRSRVRFPVYQICWEVVGLERGPLSLVRIIEELLEWKSSGSSQENRINERGDQLRWQSDTLYPQKLALISPTSGGRSVRIIRLRTKGQTEFSFS